MGKDTTFRGVTPVMPTALTADGEAVDEQALRRYVRFLLDNGVHGLIPLGSTGENPQLTEAERKLVIDVTMDEVAGKVPVFAGTGCTTTRETIMYSQYAERAGATGVMVVHPYYCPPSEYEIEEHYKAVAASISIPIMIYNNTFCSAYDMKPEQVCRLAEVDNISYIKESSVDVQRVAEIIALCGDKMTVFCGWDTLVVESLTMGAMGWTSACADLIPRQSVNLFELAVDKQEFLKARDLYYKIQPLLIMLESSGKFMQYVKAGCEILGVPVGPPRRPSLPVKGEEREKLKKALERALS